MRQITDATIVDFCAHDDGFVFSTSDLLESGAHKISFYSYDAKTQIVTPVTKTTYADLKFGVNADAIAESLGKNGGLFLTDCTRLPDNRVAALDDYGNFSLFAKDGSLIKKNSLIYRGYPARSPVAFNNTIWCAVPQINAIINYSLDDEHVHIRVGGEDQKTFSFPQSLTLVDNKLYICNRDSGKIRALQIEGGYTIVDYLTFKEPVYKYIRSCEKDFVLLESGIYEI